MVGVCAGMLRTELGGSGNGSAGVSSGAAGADTDVAIVDMEQSAVEGVEGEKEA